MNLEPIDPQTAVELYLADRETELRRSTINAHRSRLRLFVHWCEERDITNLNGRLLHEYRI